MSDGLAPRQSLPPVLVVSVVLALAGAAVLLVQLIRPGAVEPEAADDQSAIVADVDCDDARGWVVDDRHEG